jgi:hypothetical protein
MFAFPSLSTARVTFKAFWLAIAAAAFIAVAGLAGVQTVRLHGFHLWPVSITGWIATAKTREAERDAEKRAHQQTKTDYRNAQAEAARLEQTRLDRVKAEQQEITDAVEADYRRQLAGLHTRAERLREELRAGAGAASAGGSVAVSGLPAAGGGSAEAAGDPGFPAAFDRDPAEQLERDVIATEQAIQLNALIDWLLKQHAIDPNADLAAAAGPQ